MNDYLAGIAARAFPQRDAIQPRVATRFEPVSPEEAPMYRNAATGPRPSAPNEAPKPTPPLSIETRFEEIERVVREIVPAEVQVVERPSRVEHETRVIERESTVASPREVHHHHHETHTERERNAGVPPAGPAASSPPLPRPQAKTPTHSARETPALQPITRTEHTERIERIERLDHTDRVEHRETRIEATPESRIIEQRTQVLPARVASHPPPLSAARTTESAPEPPSVHVTIGRVEIRASTQPEKQRPAAQSQAPSLAEYLRRRDRRSPG